MSDPMDKISDGLLAILDKTGHLLSQYGGDAVDLALQFSRASAVVDIVTGILYLILAVAMIKFSLWFGAGKWRNDKSMHQCMYDSFDDSDAAAMACIASWIVLVVLTVIPIIRTLVNLLDVWSWISIFYPKIGLVHQLYIDMIPKK